MKKLFISLFIIAGLGIMALFSINAYVKQQAQTYIISINDDIEDVDAIVVLGCKVDGERLSLMLADRLDLGVKAYKQGLSGYIMMSGDHEYDDYNEIDPMKNYALTQGISEDSILVDRYGLSTYDSLYRLKHIYHFDKVIIVTQNYHLYRALYIAKSLGLQAYGLPAQGEHYVGQSYRELREIVARNKDFMQCIIKPASKYNE